nr:peptidoglycan bridge formation glycyltransferase FemA/FemB family protein [Desulfobacula sp.]
MITLAGPSDKENWNAYVLNHPQGIAYQLFAWKEAVEKAYGFKGLYLMAGNGNKTSGILPLIRVNLPFASGSLVSLPYCDAGGPLADSPDIEHQLISEAFNLASTMGIRTVSLRATNPLAGYEPDTTLNRNKVRMLLRLPDNSEKLLASFKAKLRSQVKKPFKDGLSVRSGGVELLNEFYPLFAENMRDLGSPVHSRNWIKQILCRFKNRAILFIVKMPDQTLAAGGILLCHPHMVSVPWASSLRRFNSWNPNMMLYWAFLKFAADNRYPLFDFGRSTPDEGTFGFKKQWGANPTPLYWADFKTAGRCKHKLQPVVNTISPDVSEKRKLAESMIIKMPIPVSKAFGNMTRRYISL